MWVYIGVCLLLKYLGDCTSGLVAGSLDSEDHALGEPS